MLHSLPIGDCPIRNRSSEYLKNAEYGYKNSRYDGSLFPDNWGYASPDCAWSVIEKRGCELECNTLLHGDYHTNNVMVQNGEPLLIDMDTLCLGHPVFELGSVFNAFLGYSELDHSNMIEFFGYTYETSEKVWNAALKLYLGTDDEVVCQSVKEKAMVIGYTRMLRRALRRPSEADSPAKIARCKQMLEYLLGRVDTLLFD